MENSLLELMGKVLMTWIEQVLWIVHMWNEDCTGVDVNCEGVDLADVCAGVDDDCTGADNVWVGVDEVCAVEADAHCWIGMTGLLASGSLSSSSIVSAWSSWLAASLLFLNASRIARSCSNLGRDLLLLMSAKAISTGHHQSLLSALPQLGSLLPVSNNKDKHKTLWYSTIHLEHWQMMWYSINGKKHFDLIFLHNSLGIWCTSHNFFIKPSKRERCRWGWYILRGCQK